MTAPIKPRSRALTYDQALVLKELVRRERIGMATTTAYILGTHTCESLRRRLLVRVEGDRPIGRHDNDRLVHLTDAGRAAVTKRMIPK